MLLRDLSPAITVNEVLKIVNGRWALVSKSNPTKVLQYYHGPKGERPSKQWVDKVESRVAAFESVILEGGNIFKNAEGPLTDRIATSSVETTVHFLEGVTGLDFTEEKEPDGKPKKWLGTTGRKEHADGTFERNSSGDLDLSVDETVITKEELVSRLAAWCQENGVPASDIMNKGTKRDGYIQLTGDSVHFKTPINGDPAAGFVQTDFMFTSNPVFQQGSLRGGASDSPLKGMHRNIILASMARAKGIKYSPKFGLIDAATNEPLPNGTNWDTIAKTLMGPTATENNTKTADSILAYIRKLPEFDTLVSAARETLGKEGITI